MLQEISRRSFLAGGGAVIIVPAVGGFPEISFAANPIHPIPDVDGRFIRTIDAATKTQSIYSFNLDLTDALVPKDLHLNVCAYSVFVSGEIKSAGRNIKIVCKTLRFADNAKFDLRGREADPDFANRPAQNGQAPGTGGKDGANGADGPDAGSLVLVCDSVIGILNVDASGRQGGGGQSGGNGASGASGPNSPNFGAIGGAGGPGGPPGHAGRPGRGGGGGRITINSVEEFPPARLVANLAKGEPGNPGAHGAPGTGGAGGWGRSGRKCERE